MLRDTVLEILKAHEPELKQLGVLGLSLFGSIARGEGERGSDIGVAVKLTEGPASGLACLARIDDLKKRLATIVGRPVDVIVEPTTHRRLQEAIDHDRQVAF
jgi:predicted nucleotidyltransferase